MAQQGALADLTVVEYSVGPAGAMCGKAFADLGADVLKIEPPEGDPMRLAGPFPDDAPNPEASGAFLFLNANKRGAGRDLTLESDRRIIRALAARADIFVTDVQPAQAARLGVDSAAMSALAPRLIRVYATPFGNSGPYRNWKGGELVTWHMGGMGWETPASFVTDSRKHPPLRGRGIQGTLFAGWAAAAGAMCAVTHRDAYGIGQEVDVSAMDVVSSHIRGNFATYSYDISKLPESREKVFFPWIWRCADGWASMTFLLDHWWAKLKAIMGDPEWARNADYDTIAGRRDNLDAVESGVAAWAKDLTRAEIYAKLQGAGIPCFPVQTVDEVAASAHYRARGFFIERDHPAAGAFVAPGPPIRFSATPWALRREAPTLGEHDAEIRALAESADRARCQDGESAAVAVPPPSADGEPRNKPLAGVRILDFGWILSVPYAGGWLGSLGAEVIRIESNTRLEPGRSSLAGGADGIAGVNRSGIWNCLNHSKLGITLNIRDPEGRRLIKELAAVSDVVMETFSTGVLERNGLGYDELRAVKPDLIMLSGSSMGTYGPDSAATGFGPNVCSYAGQPSVTGYAGGQPQNLGGNWPDYLVGTMMVHSVLSALRHRRKTGEGQKIEAAMAEVVSYMMPEAFLDWTMNGRIAERIGNRDPRMSPHNVYPGEGEDAWLAIEVATETEWRSLCAAIGRPELAADARFATLADRKRNEDALDALIAEWTSARAPMDAARALQAAGVAAGPVMDAVALMADDHFRARGVIVEMDHPEVGPREVAGLPMRFSDMPIPAHYPAPRLGEHNDAIIGALLGNPPPEVERLKETRAVH